MADASAAFGSPLGSTSVLQVVAGLDPAHGGPSYSVPRLCSALAEAGAHVKLLSVLTNGASTLSGEQTFEHEAFAPFGVGLPVLGGLRLSSGLGPALKAGVGSADVVHNHGLWLAPNMQAQAAASRAGKPFVVSPRGMLSAEALAISRQKKRLMWGVRQGASLRAATCLHATSEQELVEIRAMGLRAPVAVIGNGIDVAPDQETASSSEGFKTLLSLGRVHPKKGLVSLLHAWARIEPSHPDWRLRIIGPAEVGHDKELAALADQLGLKRVSIEPPVYGAGKQALYHQADAFVLSTKSENFGLTVAESLAAGTPVICTRSAPWGGLERERCGWWVDQGVEAMAAGLAQALAASPETRAEMGRRGRAWMLRDYSWGRVAEDMLDLYAWLQSGGVAPAFVALD